MAACSTALILDELATQRKKSFGSCFCRQFTCLVLLHCSMVIERIANYSVKLETIILTLGFLHADNNGSEPAFKTRYRDSKKTA